jgi:hypothetical protein
MSEVKTKGFTQGAEARVRVRANSIVRNTGAILKSCAEIMRYDTSAE